MNPESQENELRLRAPQELLTYEQFWRSIYGREMSEAEDAQLVELVKSLSQRDEKFKAILSESLLAEFNKSENGQISGNGRKWALISAMSKYGMEFGLQVD